jgi:hypothetical protein
LRGRIGDEEINRQGSWSVRDIDMINAVGRLNKASFKNIRA